MDIIGVVYTGVEGAIIRFFNNPTRKYPINVFNDKFFPKGVFSFSPDCFCQYWKIDPYLINYKSLTPPCFCLKDHERVARNYTSISLSAFLSPLACRLINEGGDVHICFTGEVETKENGDIVVNAVSEIDKKYAVFSNWVNVSNPDHSYAFIYVSKEKIEFNNQNSRIRTFYFPSYTPVKFIEKRIEYYIKNTVEVLKKDKHIYSKIIEDELNNYKEKIKSIDFYFPGDKSSRLLFDTSIFTAIDGIINRNADFSLNFYTLEYYASQQRMDGQKKIPTWINNFKDNAAKINKINDSLSIFSHNMDPQFGMLIDSIVKTKSKVTLRQFEVDGNAFFDKNYKNRSAIIISYKGEPSWMCYSEVPSFWEENEFEEQSSRICITKTEGQIKDNVEAVQTLFKENLDDSKDSLSTGFQPFVLIGFPGTGKTEITKFFARMENIGNDDPEAEKVFSSDDRINNRAYSDNEESKLFRSKFDWAYPSREEAKDRIKQLVKEKFRDKEGDALKELVRKLYRDNIESDDVMKLKESLDDYFYRKDYREIEYNIRTNQVLDSIDLAWILHQRTDLGAKEILENTVRRRLYLRNYKTIFLINANKPFEDTYFSKAQKIITNLTENTWACVKENLIEIENDQTIIQKENNQTIFENMSNHAFSEYFKNVFEEHPEIADKVPRRNIFDYKNKALDGKCENCDKLKKRGCDNNCNDWQCNKDKFKDILKKEIWEKRFPYYLKYSQYFIVRKQTIQKTADAINNIIDSPLYGKNVINKADIPAAYCNNEQNSFAEYTVKNRFHEIWEAEFKDSRWNEFIAEHKVSEFIKNTRGDLKEYLNNFSDSTLQDFFNNAEFLRSEFFLYHIMIEQCKSENKEISNLFLKKKNDDWTKKTDNELIPKLEKIVYQTSTLKAIRINEYLNFMTTGNAHDLSQETNYIPAKDDKIKLISNGINPINDVIKQSDVSKEKAIYNEIFNFLNKRKYKRFDIISDNAGVELFSDYLFALYLLQTNTVEKIVLHLKPKPMFVSDATKADYESLNDIIKDYSKDIHIMFAQYKNEDRLEIKTDEEEFFYEPYFKDCKFIEDIMKAGCELLVVKGDLNYRRLVGDVKWKWTQPIKPIIAPFVTCKCLCLRCIKSDVLLGLSEEDAEMVENIPNKKELPDGKYATIQFI